MSRLKARTRTRAHAHAHTHTHTRTHARTHTRTHARTHIRMHARAHTHTYTHTYTHTHTHTHTCISAHKAHTCYKRAQSTHKLPVHSAKGFANFSASLTMLPPTCSYFFSSIFSLKFSIIGKKLAVTRKILSDDENIFAQGPKIFPSGHTQIEQNIFHIFFFRF